MKNLKLNVSTEEITRIINEEKSTVKDKYNRVKNLALLTDDEKLKLIWSQKVDEFYLKNRKQCEEFENKINKMLDARRIEYRDIFEGDYKYFYHTWVEDEGKTFEELLEMMRTIIEDYEHHFATYSMLYTLFDFEYID